jgi:putative phosphoesterase
MKIAIISDTHDNIPNLEKALDWINQNNISIIIHCGDLCTPSILTKVILSKFSGQIYLVPGNVGNPELLEKLCQDFERVKFYREFGEIDLANKKIAFTHRPEKVEELAKTRKYDIIFYGHTHKPWIQKTQINADSTSRDQRESVLLVNPGNLAGMFYKATFAVYETENGKLELKILELL